MSSGQSSVFGLPSSAILFGVAVCSFLFYGVVGQDKTWLLAPAITLTFALVAMALFARAVGQKTAAGGERTEDRGPRTDERGQGTEVRGQGSGECGQSTEGRGPSSVNRPQSSVPSLPSSAWLWITFLLYGVFLISKATVPFESKLTILFIGGVVGAYLVWGSELTAFKDNRILLGVLIFVVMIAALYGLVVHFKCPDRVLWTERYAIYEGRLMSTYICPNHFAHLMQMLMPFCVALLFIPQAGLYLRILSAYSFLVFLPPLYLTESRAGWLGVITATGVVLCLMALRRSKKLFAFLIILVPLCSMLLLLGGWQYSETFQRRMQPVVEFLQQQNEEGVGSDAKDFRPQTWMDTIDMIKEAPLIGFGPGNYRYTFPEHRKRFQGERIVTGHPHNEYLELIADYGLIGFGLFALAWCYGLIRILIASLRADEPRHAFIGFAFIGTAAGTLVHSFFDFQMHIYPNALVFALLAALAWGPLAAQRVNPSRGKRQKALGTRGRGDAALECGGSTPLSTDSSELFAEEPSTINHQLTTRLRRTGAWLLAVGYLLGALFCLQIMGSSFIRALGDKKSEALATRTSEAVGSKLSADRLYILAIRLDPQNWRAYKGMGRQLFDRRYYSLEMDEKIMLAKQERSWYEKAYGHNPKDPEICMAYGKVLIFLGRSAISQQPLAISQKQSEDSIQHTADSASITSNLTLLTSNQFQARGLELLREACKYRPFNDVYWWILGVELRKVGRYEEALDVFRRAASINRTPSMKMNIEWLEGRLKALDDDGGAVDSLPLQAEPSKINTQKLKLEKPAEPVLDLDTTGAVADPGLMDLLDKMGE